MTTEKESAVEREAAFEAALTENIALRVLLGAGCDANNDGVHECLGTGTKEFCIRCGEMTRNGKSKPWMNEDRLERTMHRLASLKPAIEGGAEREVTLRVRPISTEDWSKLPEREQQLNAIGDVIGYWIKWVTRQHEAENLTVTVDTHIVLPGENAPPSWPSMGQLGRWLEVLRDSGAAVEREAIRREAFVAGYREGQVDVPNDDSSISLRLFLSGMEVADRALSGGA